MSATISGNRKFLTWSDAFLTGVKNIIFCALFIFLVQSCRSYLGVVRLEHVREGFIKENGADTKFCTTFNSSSKARNENFTGVRVSGIEGEGLFATKKIPCGCIISTVYKPREDFAIGHLFWEATERIGKKINHHDIPNVKTVMLDNRWDIFALRDINRGEELLADYVDQPYFILPPMFFWDMDDANELGFEWYPRNAIAILEFMGLPLIVIYNSAS